MPILEALFPPFMTLFRAPSKRPPSDTEDRASSARLAAEAFFAAAPVAAEIDHPAPQVIVKRRRKVDMRPGTPPEVSPGDRIEQRAPKTHLPSTADRQEGAEADPAQQPAPQPVPTATPRRRRVRRALNGAVTIIRPPRNEQDVQTDAAERSPDPWIQPTQPGADHWPPALRYPRLLAQIRTLEQEAVEIERREHAVRWITRAIRAYGLTEADIGL